MKNDQRVSIFMALTHEELWFTGTTPPAWTPITVKDSLSMNLPVKDGAHLRPSRRPTLSYKVGLLSDECVLAEEGERKVRYGAAVVMEE